MGGDNCCDRRSSRASVTPSFFCVLLGLSGTASALETRPWLSDEYAFNFGTAFTYSRYHQVEGAAVQLSAPRNDRDFLLDLSFTPGAQFDMQGEIELAKTNSINWTLRSAALQARYQMLDDISGDPLSLTFGMNVRGAPHHFLRDVGTPYAAECNVEMSCAAGKEWSKDGMWTMRTYGFATVGIANRGLPWTRELFVWEVNWQDTHRLSLFTAGNVGFGGQQHVNVNHFDGWGKIQHQSVDLGVAYGYHFFLYGTLSVSYAYRLFAHNFPERVNAFALSYCVPFSLF